MPDPIEAPYLNWDLPNAADRIFETNPSRSTKDREEFLAELKRRQEKQQKEDEEQQGESKEETQQDTFERTYTTRQPNHKIAKTTREEDTDSPGQVVDFKA